MKFFRDNTKNWKVSFSSFLILETLGLNSGLAVNLILIYLTGSCICSAIDFQSTLDPKFLPTPTNLTYIRGEPAILYCSVENIGNRYIIWRRTSDPNPITVGTTVFVSDPRYYVREVKYRHQYNLHIKNVSHEDAGLYECQVSSKERNIRKIFLLTVIEPSITSPRLPRKPDIVVDGSKYVEIGNQIYLMCNVTSDDVISETIEWYKDGIRIVSYPKERIKVTRSVSKDGRGVVSVLTIDSAVLIDQGTYVCSTSDLKVTSISVHVLTSQFGVKGADIIESSSKNGAKSYNFKRAPAQTQSPKSDSSTAAEKLASTYLPTTLMSLLPNMVIILHLRN